MKKICLCFLFLLPALFLFGCNKNSETHQFTVKARLITDLGESVQIDMIRDENVSNFEGKYKIKYQVSDDENFKNIIENGELESEGDSFVINLNYHNELRDKITYVKVTAMDKNKTIDTALVKVEDGLPQLTVDNVKAVVGAMTTIEKANMVTGDPTACQSSYSGGTIAIDRLGVPATTVNDGPAGVRYASSTWYPSISNISSSWDNELIENVGVSIGNDAIDHGVDVVLGPGMNIQKNVLGGRNFEYSSEDPYLTGKLMSSYVLGVQKTGSGACIKHFAANNQESSRSITSANVSERALREIYLKAFGIVVDEADPYCVMSSYNAINGVHTSVNRELLHDILREQFGFKGYVMSDWGAYGSMTEKVNAENDINMEGRSTDAGDVLKALESGKITEENLNICCENILNVVAKLAEGKTKIDNKYDAVKTAANTMVLLKNDDALPFKKGTTVEILGDGARNTVYGGSGSGSVNARKYVSFYDGFASSDDFTISENADTAIIIISRGSSEGADNTPGKGGFLLTDEESLLVENTAKLYHERNKKVIVVLNTGNPIEVVSWRDNVDAIIWAGYPGELAGDALLAVVSGEINPSAKLTITWPEKYNDTPAHKYFPGQSQNAQYYEDVYVGYRYYETFDVPVAYEFGYGLSYTEFEYSGFCIKEKGDEFIVTINVKNVGKSDGRDIVQVYVQKPETSLEQPSKELCGYAKTKLLKPGKSQKITVTVSKNDFQSFDTASGSYVISAGSYGISVGSSVKNITFSDSVKISEASSEYVGNKLQPKKELKIISKATYKPEDEINSADNIALNCKAKSNFSEGGDYGAEKALDGNLLTRWSGLGCKEANHTWEVDLGKVYSIDYISIRWESISKNYEIYFSENGKDYELLKKVNVSESADDLDAGGKKARYVRVEIPTGGFVSMFEFAAYEKN